VLLSLQKKLLNEQLQKYKTLLEIRWCRWVYSTSFEPAYKQVGSNIQSLTTKW